MKYCTRCGRELVDQAVVCPGCGSPQIMKNVSNTDDASNFLFALLGFFVPIVGLILWLIWKDSTPLKAKSAGKGALIGVITATVAYIIYFIIMVIMFILLGMGLGF